MLFLPTSPPTAFKGSKTLALPPAIPEIVEPKDARGVVDRVVGTGEDVVEMAEVVLALVGAAAAAPTRELGLVSLHVEVQRHPLPLAAHELLRVCNTDINTQPIN